MRDINGREGSTVTSGSKQGIYTDYKKKFIRESQNLSKLKHPNIIKVVEAFEANNTVYYAMEFVDGGSLDEMISSQNGISERQTIEISLQLCSALSYMHNNGMLHLDLKPSNIMMRDGYAILIDFGLSKQYDDNGAPESSTTVGGGTPGYAPIEQANHHDGKGFPVTMDIYALGATILKMLTNKRPPDASQILNDGFPEDWLTGRVNSSHLIKGLEKAMSPLKKSRWQSIEEFGNLLESIYNKNCKESISNQNKTAASNDNDTQVIDVEDTLFNDGDISLPIRNNNDFLTDYSLLQVGDYLYADGSFSGNHLRVKPCVGIVFSLETSTEERKHGWTHGLVVSMNDAPVAECWGPKKLVNKSIVINGKSVKRAMGDIDGYLHSYKHYTSQSYKAIVTAKNLSAPEQFCNSGWYLPSIGQLARVFINLSSITEDELFNWDLRESNLRKMLPLLNNLGISDKCQYYSSSENSEKKVWGMSYSTSKSYPHLFLYNACEKEFAGNIRPILAF